MKEKLYLILGFENVYNWDQNEIQDIDENEVVFFEFETEEEKKRYIKTLPVVCRGYENFLIIDEDEYNFIVN